MEISQRSIAGCLLCVVLLLLVLPVSGQSAEVQKIPVTFLDASGRELCRFEAEPAVTPYEQSRGLMFRPYLPPKFGMLFINDRDEIHHYWMKNVSIPLDIIFINGNKVVTFVHQDAHPFDETTISSRYPARYILEINAGEAKACTIKRGTKTRFGTSANGK